MTSHEQSTLEKFSEVEVTLAFRWRKTMTSGPRKFYFYDLYLFMVFFLFASVRMSVWSSNV